MDEIFIIGRDGNLEELHAQEYDSEDLLQRMLAEYPNLLCGTQIDPASPRRWILVRREMGIGSMEDGGSRWSVDHLFLDQDGIPTLVEVKRSTDTRIRREVVGQMLDYAANAVVYWPVEEIRSRFAVRCEALGTDAEREITAFMGEGGDPEEFWERVKTNIRAGKIRLLFVADKVPQELQRAVEFLNSQMNPAEVLALEIKQYAGAGLQTLVPRVIGQTAETIGKRVNSSREKRQWDETSYFARLGERNAPDETLVAEAILHWTRQNVTRVWWGNGKLDGSFVGVLNHGDFDHPLFAVYTSGQVEIYFQHLKYKPAFAEESVRLELLRKLNVIPGVALPEDAITRRPSLKLSLLANEDILAQFLAVMDWVVKRIRA